MFGIALLTAIALVIQSIEAVPVASSTSAEEPSATFPTNIGYLGSTATGKAPFLAQTDDIPAKTGIPTKAYTLPQPWESAQAYDHTDADESIYHFMGSISPYYVSDGWGVYDYAMPDQCKIETLHLLSRHGSRYSTSSTNPLAEKLSATNFTASGNLSFLNDWEYSLGNNILTSLGNQQLFDKGVRTFFRYGGLYNFTTDTKLVARTTSEERMTMSALYFLNGFFGLNWQDYAELEIIIENDGFNNTLDASADCPNNDNTAVYSDDLVESLSQKYLAENALDRINGQIEGITFDTDDLYQMQALCTYEANTLGYSKFCSLFSQEEWEWYGYLQDISFYYGDSFGNPSARGVGIGWVTEFQNRLTGTAYNASQQSTQNSTLDSNPDYFPLDQPLYFDFTHDTIIASILTAFGFEQFKSPFDFSGPRSDPTTYKSSQFVPFGAQLYFEIIDCDEEVPVNRSTQAVSGSSSTKYIHAILNDHTISLSENVPDYCESRVDGWCKLDSFVEYLGTLQEIADFEYSCYGTYNFTQPATNGVPVA